jgi:hypothetical protein
MTDTGVQDEHEDNKTNADLSSSGSNATSSDNSIIEGLRGDIRRLEQKLGGATSANNQELGAVKQELAETKEDLKKALSKFEEAAKKPKATLVPPPPPPPDEDTTTPLPANQAPTTAKRKGWTKVW